MSDSDIRHLRGKVILVSLIAVALSLTALIFAINYAHYQQVDASLLAAMEEIGNNLDVGRGEVSQGSDQQMHGQGRVVADAEGAGEGVGGVHVGHGDRKSAKTQYASRFFCVFVGADGNMFVKAKGNSELTNEYACDLARQAIDLGRAEGRLDDYRYAVQKTDDLTRVLFLDCTTDIQALNQLIVVSLAVGGCAFAIAALFVVRFSGLAVRPLEESARKQKRFVADAGHELKTPLSVIATNMDILEVDLADQPEEQEWIESTNRQVRNMRHLVDDLIVLSKLEEQEADLVLVEVSLTDLAHECVLTFEQLARANGKALVASIEEGVSVRADEPAIRQLMQILVDNAIKYATGDGTILVEVTRKGRGAVFATRNHWDHGVDSRELSSLFDRFVRGEQSRDRSGGASGYGLGLSIARTIANRNGARLDVSEDDEGRIVFRVVFGR
ncbi:MAG: hypothetical protein IKF78_04585 [Atopobiaceae bacterium]|nr:hypothetical protein [Atopobiaceae bacterium]